MNIFILHPGKANYPEVEAYKKYFSRFGFVTDGTINDYRKLNNKSELVLWCIMGYYPNVLEAKIVIHDYRSLSVGFFAKVKDRIKFHNNFQPDIRIFQNEIMYNVMGFNDAVPCNYIPMGIPDWIYELESDSSLPFSTFSYIGEISRERKMHKVIESFLDNMDDQFSFVLVGNPDSCILKRYSNIKNIVFAGKIEQYKALQIVKNSNYAVCRFPSHYPHCFQVPTKYLEYAALDKIIICNDSPSNRRVSNQIQSNVLFTDDFIFTKNLAKDLENFKPIPIPRNYNLCWSNVIDNSNMIDFILNKVGNPPALSGR